MATRLGKQQTNIIFQPEFLVGTKFFKENTLENQTASNVHQHGGYDVTYGKTAIAPTSIPGSLSFSSLVVE